MLSDCLRGGILNRDVLHEIGRALKGRSAFQPGMAAFSRSMSSRFSIFGLRLRQARVSRLRLSVQLWDLHLRDRVGGSG